MRLTLTLLFLSCAGAARAAAPAAVPAAAEVAVSTPVPTVEQFYAPANLRDPLVASTVYSDQKGTTAKPKDKNGAAAVEKGTFSVYGLTLTGIMEDSRGREALLRDASGAVYTLKAGRLSDSKNKPVPGVSGVVKGKQVVLMTEDKKVHQLNLHQKE